MFCAPIFFNSFFTRSPITKKLQDLRSMSREEYIKEYGDVFESSINILNLPDSEFVGAELTDSEKKLLEEFEKQSGKK